MFDIRKSADRWPSQAKPVNREIERSGEEKQYSAFSIQNFDLSLLPPPALTLSRPYGPAQSGISSAMRKARFSIAIFCPERLPT